MFRILLKLKDAPTLICGASSSKRREADAVAVNSLDKSLLRYVACGLTVALASAASTFLVFDAGSAYSIRL